MSLFCLDAMALFIEIMSAVNVARSNSVNLLFLRASLRVVCVACTSLQKSFVAHLLNGIATMNPTKTAKKTIPKTDGPVSHGPTYELRFIVSPI